MTSLNHKPDRFPPVICDFGWTFGTHQRLPEDTYTTGTTKYPPGLTQLQANVTLPVANIPTTYGSLAELQANFPSRGTIVLDNATIHAVVAYTSLAALGGGLYGFSGCTGGTGSYTAVSPITAIYDPRFYIDSIPMSQAIEFDTQDRNNLGLPTLITPSGVTILAYHWDFGNGEIGYGPHATTTYTYSIPALSTQATLTVVDSYNRKFSCAKRLNLREFALLWGTAVKMDYAEA